jgi:hypothetical protein
MNFAAALDTALLPTLGWLMGTPNAAHVPAAPVRQTWLIRHGDTLVVDRPQGQAVICTEGALWITQDMGPADGQPGAADEDPRMLVHALSDATVQFVQV